MHHLAMLGFSVILCALPLAGVSAGAEGAEEPATPAAAAPVPLNPAQTVLLDLPNKRLLLKTQVVLREGVLEMFICKAQTKEHESVLSVDADAYLIHAGLLALGARPGSPARFDEKYHPPAGQKIDIFVIWTDEEGQEHRERSQSWIRHVTRRYYEHPLAALPAGVTINDDRELRYDEQNKLLLWFGPMTDEQRDELLALSSDKQYQEGIRLFHKESQPSEIAADFLFTGSSFYKQKDGSLFYQAESGNIICVANFSDAMIDVSVESSASNANLLFEPYTERIPPLGTPVTVELIPAPDEGEQPAE